LTPLLTIALGLFVLAWVERSFALGLFAAAFLTLALVVNLYDIENLFQRVGMGVPVPAISLMVSGSVLLLAGVLSWNVSRRR
jgi:hypothetical protein